MRVQKSIEISCAHILDLPYESKCNMLHGHNYRFTAAVEGEKDDTGMVLDYTILGGVMKEILNEWDHKTFIPMGRADVHTEQNNWITANYPTAHISMPRPTVIQLPDVEQSTAENIAEHFWKLMAEKLKAKGYRVDHIKSRYRLGVAVQETDGTASVYGDVQPM